MNILYIWDADYPWDVRVEKICSSMASQGHNIHIAARNLKRRQEYEYTEGLHIHRLKYCVSDRINYALTFPAFFSPVWKHFIDRIILSHHINLIIVRDLPLAITGITAGKRSGIPVILDMAEDYVALIRDIWKARKFHGLNLLVRNPHLAKIVERYVFQHVDHTLVVVDEARDMVVSRGGNLDRITIVGNTPSLSAFQYNEMPANGNLELIKKRYSAVYTGGIQLGRGIQTVIEALPGIVKKCPEFLFVVIGDGYATKQLKARIQEKQLHEHILWVGWVNHRSLFDYIRLSKIGLIPHLVSDHVNTTMPNKIFDYMGCGIPVLASDSLPIKRILEEEKCGLTFKSGDAKDLTRNVLNICESQYDYGKNGVEAIRRKYNWHEDEKRLLKAVSAVL
jgi:glycosyltransferase involved in cell wall biosynthesis